MRLGWMITLSACMAFAALVGAVYAAPPGCPWDGTGDGRVDIEDLYHLNQNPADINGDGLANAEDLACLEQYLRCVEWLDMAFRPGEPAADGLVPSASYRQTADMGGLTQALAVTRTPSPDGPSCISQTWTATVLGTRPGLSGPVEIRLDRDGFLWQALFADAASTSPGTTARRGMLTCEGSAIEFVAATSAMTVRSSSESRALVLLDGQNVTAMAVAKGVADAASRIIGGGLVAGYVDVDGNVSLPTRGMLVLYELDPGTTSDPSFAFDDAALLVDVECGDIADTTPQLIVLRDSIGPDISMTDGNYVISTNQGGTNHDFAWCLLTPSQNVRLVQVDVVVSSVSSSGLDLRAFDYEFRIWSGVNEEAAHTATLASPLNGLSDIFFPALTAQPPVFGHARSLSAGNPLVPTYLLSFDVSSGNIHLQSGQAYGVTIAPRRNGGGSFGTAAMVESTQAGLSDRKYWAPSNWDFLSNYPPFQHDGRIGIRVIGMTE